MIVRTMEIPEIWYQIQMDYDKIEYYIKKMYPKAVKEFSRNHSDNYPLVMTESYENKKSHNKYLIYCYSMDLDQDWEPKYGFAYFFDYKDERYVIKLEERETATKDNKFVEPIFKVYIPHYIKRFRDRFLKTTNYDYDTLIAKMLAVNHTEELINVNETIVKKYKEYRNPQAIRSPNGMSLVETLVIGDKFDNIMNGYLENRPLYIKVIKYMTFLSEDIMKKDQSRESFERMKEECFDKLEGLAEYFDLDAKACRRKLENNEKITEEFLLTGKDTVKKSEMEEMADQLKANGSPEMPILPGLGNIKTGPVLDMTKSGKKENVMSLEYLKTQLDWYRRNFDNDDMMKIIRGK